MATRLNRAPAPRVAPVIVALATVALATVAIVAAGCAGGTSPAPASASVPASVLAPPSGSLVSDIARGRVIAALGDRSIGVEDAQAPYRPAEPPLLAGAPRTILQVFLPDDPSAGYIVLYEFPSEAEAATAGRAMADYIASGPGRVYFAPDARFVLRAVSTTLVFYTYAPGSLTNPAAAAAVADALSTIGSEIPVRG